MQKQSLMKRKPKSDVASQFVGVLSEDKHGRPATMVVPGSHGKQYHVILRRYTFQSDLPLITTECRLQVGWQGYSNCKGNTHKNLCYHSRAAVDAAIELAGFKASWCQEYHEALTLNRMLKGHIKRVKSHQSGVEVYIVVSKKDESQQLGLGL